MELSRLTVKGFKSFGDRVTIHFNQGVTGVVGPNGCGKSNIVDAIRWVLGEQRTRHLRSDKMENVIFNGTKDRRPQQMAEVALTFLNTKKVLPTEYTEVTVARRYYRSGDSEYLLNGVVCRLKDITSLFMDTGIGPDSYAIIELKMVDDLLNDQNNARRNLFEEAAGVSKFKSRKKETLKKLNDTEQDLDRVEDLLAEIAKNMRQLEKQARQAQRYFTIKEEYRTASVALARVRVRRQEAARRRIEEQLRQEEAGRAQVANQLAETEQAVVALKDTAQQQEASLRSQRDALAEHTAEANRLTNQRQVLTERLQHLHDRRHALRRQADQEAQQQNDRRPALAKLTELVEAANRRVAETTQKATDANAEQTLYQQAETDAEARYRTTENAYRQHYDDATRHAQQADAATARAERLRTDLEAETQQQATQQHRQAEQAARLQAACATAETAEAQVADARATTDRCHQALVAAQQAAEQCRQERRQAEQALAAREHELKVHRSLTQRSEGFSKAVRYLRDQGWTTPLVADLISADAAWRPALESALAEHLNTFVVNTEAEAQALIAAAHGAGGPVQVVVLEVLSTAGALPPLADTQAALAVAAFAPEHRPLATALLHDVFVWKGPGEASTFPSAPAATVVSADGALKRRGAFWFSGEAVAAEGQRLGRQQHLERLTEAVEALRQRTANRAAAAQTASQQVSAREAAHRQAQRALRAAEEQAQKLARTLAAEEARYEQLQGHEADYAQRCERLQAALDALAGEEYDRKPRLTQARAALAKTESQRTAADAALKEARQAYRTRQERANATTLDLQRAQSELSSLRREVAFKQESLKRSAAQITQWRTEAVSLEEREAVLKEEVAALSASAEAQQTHRTAAATAVSQQEQQYAASRGQLEAQERQVRTLRQHYDNAAAVLEQLRQKLNEVTLDLTALRERLSVEFDVELPTDDSAPSEASEAELETRVQRLRQQRDRLGPVNPIAVEAFEEIRQRHDFIAQERDDLRTARQGLLDTIEQVDAVARETFLKTYEQVRDNFQRVFRSLFTEDDACDLKLIDPQDPLESRIEIVARPKGKRPLTINQLSGGEKTLTATALLFAIYLIKPAPFCIFDEVDAPLDDANIDKFNQIVREFSDQSQFIIVTHNKRTMLHTDVIYGVTMIEAGVSQVVPVDLRAMA